MQLVYPDMSGGANKVSLFEAQKNFINLAVSDSRFKDNVREVSSEDKRDELWRPIDLENDLYLHWNSDKDQALWKAYKDEYTDNLYYWRDDFWLRRPQPVQIEEDETRGIVTINGQEFSGFVKDVECKICHSPIIYDDDFDSEFCPGCNMWTEKHPVCSDKSCYYCNKTRPARPLLGPKE